LVPDACAPVGFQNPFNPKRFAASFVAASRWFWRFMAALVAWATSTWPALSGEPALKGGLGSYSSLS
jgi:hypothetical protein